MKTFIACLFLLITGLSFTQQKDSIRSKVPAFVVKGTLGASGSNKLAFTDAEWERRTPGFQIPDSFQVNPNGNDYFSSEPDNTYWMLSFSFITNKESVKKYRWMTTVHVGLGPETSTNKYWFHENRKVLDTLTSNQSGDSYYVVGNRRQDIQKSYRSKSTLIGIGEHFATSPENVFQFETGLDVLFLINSTVTQSALTESYLIEGIVQGNYVTLNPPVINDPQITNYDGKSVKGMIIRVPLELSVPLSVKNQVLKRMRIGVELNIGLALQFTRGKTSSNLSSNTGLNFRYEFSKFNTRFLSKRQKPAWN